MLSSCIVFFVPTVKMWDLGMISNDDEDDIKMLVFPVVDDLWWVTTRAETPLVVKGRIELDLKKRIAECCCGSLCGNRASEDALPSSRTYSDLKLCCWIFYNPLNIL
jgi:hypothetical protein